MATEDTGKIDLLLSGRAAGIYSGKRHTDYNVCRGSYKWKEGRRGLTGIYVILTGYELRAGKVFPLDGVAPFEEYKLPLFAPYDGVEEAVFLKTIRDLL